MGDFGLLRRPPPDEGSDGLRVSGERRNELACELAFERKTRDGGRNDGVGESASSVLGRDRRMRVMVESVTESGCSSSALATRGAKWVCKSALPPKG